MFWLILAAFFYRTSRRIRSFYFIVCLIVCCSSAATENSSSLSAASATTASTETSSSSAAAAAAATAGTPVASSGSDAVAVWQLEVFGTWRSLSDSESSQIERAYSDPNNDTMFTSVVVSMVLFMVTNSWC